jgi:hypothetical protein
VLLFTERALIDPSNAGRRTPTNFYSSRQDGGLRKTTGGDEIFIVPSAVLRGFAAAFPRPSAIYYTVAVYAAPDGASPAFPAPPQLLALDAPSVTVAADFTPDTFDRVLGVRSGRLQVVAQALDAAAPVASTAPAATAPAPPATPTNGQTPAPAIAPQQPAAATPAPIAPAPAAVPPGAPSAGAPAAAPVDPAVDAAAGEDGYSYLAAHPEPAAEHPAGPPAGDTFVYDDGHGDYDDGWGTQAQAWSSGQEAAFPAGFPEPAPLVDEEGGNGWAPVSAEELTGVSPLPYRGLDDGEAPVAADGSSGSSGGAGSAVAGPPVAAPPATAPMVSPPAPPSLSIDDKRAIIERIAGSESGSDRYGAINADGEYKGRFGPDHPAYHHHHIGLSYGIIQFTQDSGNLGRLVSLMRDRDDAMFRQTLGENADELIRVTNATGPPASESPDGRSARTQPVGGADLWEEPWISRFRQAGQVIAFQSAQNELAATSFVDPMIGFAGDLGLDTDRALTMAVDRAIQMGVAGARQWICAAVGPISTTQVRQQALAALGFGELSAFQQAWRLPVDNLWGPLTHAGLAGALRQLGDRSPISLPTVDQMLDGMVRRADADGVFWASRVRRLRTAEGFTDRAYAR